MINSPPDDHVNDNGSLKQAAHTISILLHPLFMPVLALWTAMQLDPHLSYFLPAQAQWFTLGMVTMMGVVFPLSCMLLLRRAGLITSLEMPHRQERIAPFVMTLIYYGMTYYLLRQTRLDGTVLSLFSGAMLALLFTTFITMRWKISVHLVGIGGLAGTIAGIAELHSMPMLFWLACSILLAGLLGTARLLTGSHVPAQVYAGGVLGFACTYACIALGLSF
ncbi:MAG: hypothetical protein WEC15_01355 [Flavobacteriales bacterium]